MRGTGQTLDMVRKLPDTGSVVVVHTHALVRYVERMIANYRGAAVLRRTKVVHIPDRDAARRWLCGGSKPVLIDHAFLDHAALETRFLVLELADGCNTAAGFMLESAEPSSTPA